jgi:hypothetical protein
MQPEREMTPAEERAFLVARLHDYDRAELADLRRRLSARWQGQHPTAAKEASAAFQPLERDTGHVKRFDDDPDEIWMNDAYNVTVRRNVPDKCFGTGRGMIQIGISNHDGTARHDWRDFQAIKNQLAGEECEAFELYPAESRLLDPSNYYTLWCFPFLKRLKLGREVRRVFDRDTAWSPQRAIAQKEQ